MNTCDECRRGKMIKKKTDYILLGQNLGKYDALVCNACGEMVFTAETFQEVETKARERGL